VLGLLDLQTLVLQLLVGLEPPALSTEMETLNVAVFLALPQILTQLLDANQSAILILIVEWEWSAELTGVLQNQIHVNQILVDQEQGAMSTMLAMPSVHVNQD